MEYGYHNTIFLPLKHPHYTGIDSNQIVDPRDGLWNKIGEKIKIPGKKLDIFFNAPIRKIC